MPLILKAFFHGRGNHSHGWDGNIMVGEVNGEFDKFDAKTYTEYEPKILNYRVELKKEPAEKELDTLIESTIAKHRNSIENPPEEPRDPVIDELIEKKILKTDTTAKTIDELGMSDVFATKAAL